MFVTPPGQVMTGGVVSSVQVKTTVRFVETPPHVLVAVMVNVRIFWQALPESTCVTLTPGVPHPPLTFTRDLIASSLGLFVGLQPRFPPVGTINDSVPTQLVTMICVQLLLLPQASVAV